MRLIILNTSWTAYYGYFFDEKFKLFPSWKDDIIDF